MTKILGYQKSEINRLYIHTTTIVTILSLIIVLPILGKLLQLIWHGVMLEYIGYIPLYIEWTVYAKVVIIGIITYAVVAILLMKKTDKIPMTDALKNVE
jgi:putative ABC transport system permease protein